MNLTKDSLFATVIDHSVSKEAFELYYNSEFDMLITSPTPEFIEKYYESDNYISHTDGNRSLFEQCYNFVKRFTLNDKVSLISRYSSATRRILDIGAGTGDFLLTAKSKGWQVTGSEPSNKARAIAKSKKLTLSESTLELPANSFDVITMWHVLEHVSDLNGQLAELKRLLSTSGTIVIAVPNFKSFDATHYKEFWAAFDVPRHLWHFSKNSISRLFQMHGFELIKVLPMKFDAFYVSLLSEKYRTGKMNPVAAFVIGLKSNLSARKDGNFSSHIYILKNLK
ncbi:MAG TPA: class I SAM-dependent methyltransferase [Flavobacterium sp.]|jgi:2-polyprenyl-3-methyl-5-hydroxy-6-metoxy-1,4-benzoquinol methylase